MIDKLVWYYLIICPFLIISTILFGIILINDLIYEAWVIVFLVSLIGTLTWLILLIWLLVEDC